MRAGRKKNVVIYLDPEVVKEAKDLGLNISKISENALKEAIRRLKGENNKNILNYHSSDDCLNGERSGRDLNPRPPAYQAGAPARLSYRTFLFTILSSNTED